MEFYFIEAFSPEMATINDTFVKVSQGTTLDIKQIHMRSKKLKACHT